MTRATVYIGTEGARQKALRWLREAPLGFIAEFKRNKRSLPQNARMWAALTAFSEQCQHHGVRYSPSDWKLIFLSALGHEMRLAPNLNGDGLVNLGASSSRLTKEEMSDLLELIEAAAAERGVVLPWHEQEEAA